MQWTGLNELRENYLSFFEGKDHLRLDSLPEVHSHPGYRACGHHGPPRHVF